MEKPEWEVQTGEAQNIKWPFQNVCFCYDFFYFYFFYKRNILDIILDPVVIEFYIYSNQMHIESVHVPYIENNWTYCSKCGK